jgi:hypothetical protein
MQYNVENSDYAVEFTAVNMDVAVTGQAEIEVAVGDAARIDVGEALNYIKTGTAEIEAVAQEKTDAFNLNAINKTNAFNDNYTAKKALIDAEVANAAASATAAGNSATDAEASATAADNSAKDAKQWAIGDPSEPTGNSAKYWANEAEATVANKQDLLTSANAGTGISITGSGANVLISNTETSTIFHNELLNRDLPNQHPIEAITGLREALDERDAKIQTEKEERIAADADLQEQIDNIDVTDDTFVYEQGIASDVWVITHNLNKYPSITLVDSAGTVFKAKEEYNSANQVTVYLNGATTGKAYLN